MRTMLPPPSRGAFTRIKLSVAAGSVAALLALCVAAPASADLTILGKYTLVGGDTLTRASYYNPKRVRVTGPDGREYVYDAKTKNVMVINHAKRTFWRGSIQQADSLATKILYESNKGLREKMEANRERWAAVIDSFNNSILAAKTTEARTIAGYPCTKFVLQAGRYLTHERWVARSLDVANYAPDLEKVVMASMLDPAGRILMRQIIAMRDQDGLPLASTTEFTTPTQQGSFSWEAISVDGGVIPASAWEAPKGYRQIKL